MGLGVGMKDKKGGVDRLEVILNIFTAVLANAPSVLARCTWKGRHIPFRSLEEGRF